MSRAWQEANRAEGLLLARPWETEGELRWVREPGGLALVGRDVPTGCRPRGQRLVRRLRRGLRRRSGQSTPRRRVLRG